MSVRELRTKIKNKVYERLPEETKLRLIEKEKTKVHDFIKNPIIIKNPNNLEVIKEKILHKLILDDMENFLEQLGDGFCFIKSELL